MTNALLTVPPRVRRGEVIEVRALIAHPMETGLRAGDDGKILPRDIITNLRAWWRGQALIDITLHPAVSANPYVAFHLRVDQAGELQVQWTGDRGFSHGVQASIRPD